MADELKLKSIDEEEADCRKAFEGAKIGDLVWHCHHESLMETLTEPPERRIDFILLSKPSHELAMRLRLFRPFLGVLPKSLKKARADRQKALADYETATADYLKAVADMEKADADWQMALADRQNAYADYRKACAVFAISVHNEFCKDCPWNGKTIFPNA